MIRLLGLPLLIGILVFLTIIFIVPEFFGEARVVSGLAEFILNQANTYFDTMPSWIAHYIASLDIFVIAVSGALVATVFVQLVVIIVSILLSITKTLISYLRRKKEVKQVTDLPPIELESPTHKKNRVDQVLGKGFDSIDRD